MPVPWMVWVKKGDASSQLQEGCAPSYKVVITPANPMKNHMVVVAITRDFYPLRNSRELRGGPSCRLPKVSTKTPPASAPEDPPLNAWKALEFTGGCCFLGFPGSEFKMRACPDFVGGVFVLACFWSNYSDRKHDRKLPQIVVNSKGNPRLFQGNLGW